MVISLEVLSVKSSSLLWLLPIGWFEQVEAWHVGEAGRRALLFNGLAAAGCADPTPDPLQSLILQWPQQGHSHTESWFPIL